MEISSETSQKIRNMSLLCAALVVSIHVPWPYNPPLSVGWFVVEAVANGIANIAVPFFFVVSGFFLARHFDEENWYRREVFKRIKTLIVPYVAWSILPILLFLPLNIVADKIAGRPFGTGFYFLQGPIWIHILGFDLSKTPLYGPLWYVRCLFLFVLTAFVLKSLIARFGYMWLVVAFAFNLLYNHIPYEVVHKFFACGYSAGGVFYFSVGIFLQRFPVNDKSRGSIAFCGLVGIGLLVSKLVFVYHGWPFATCIGKLSLPFLLYFTWGIMSTFKLPFWLTSSSFPIYLMHLIIIVYIDIVVKRASNVNLRTIGEFIAFFGSIAASIAGAVVLRRFFPRFANVVFGGR